MIRTAILASCIAVFAMGADCQEVRVPAAGKPAATFKVPQGWKPDRGPPGAAAYSSQDGSTHVQVMLGRDPGRLDAIANGIAQQVNGLKSIKRTAELKVDGHPAASFDMEISGSGGRPFKTILTLIRVDPLWAMNVTQVFGPGTSADEEAAATSVVASVKLEVS